MNWHGRTSCILLAMGALALGVATAQKNADGPDTPRQASASVLVYCDMACNWKLDGESKGRIEAGSSARETVSMGQHLVNASTTDGADSLEREVDIRQAGQTLVRLEFTAQRQARLSEASTDAQNKANQGLRLYYAKRYDEAKPILEEACANGGLSGCVGLGFMYLMGEGVTQDYSEAHRLYVKACDGGNMTGCYSLGYLYDQGDGVTQDRVQARRLYRKACDGNEWRGCSSLGFLWEHGQGGDTDYAQARELFEKACDGKEYSGCNGLGYLYQNGMGVTRDIGQARTYYKQACDGGNQTGCSNLKAVQ